MNIVLIGLRGSGKTKVGKIIAKKLGWDFVDLDEKIEKSERKKIAKIVEMQGWEYFRACESQAVEKTLNLKNTVIATGGGVVLDPNNISKLKKNGKLVYLYVQPEVCAERIANDKNRPPLTNMETVDEEMQELYKQRNGLYCKSAQIIFQCTDSAKEDAQAIIDKVNLYT